MEFERLIPHFILKNFQEGVYQGRFTCAVLFADISGFTALTEKLTGYGKAGTEILSAIINDIFTPCINSVYQRGGFISTFAGDAFTALFQNKSGNALLASKEIIDEIKRQHIKQTIYGNFEISAKIGLSYGPVEWGITGKGSKKAYYFKGPAIDQAAKSEYLCGKMDIVSDSQFYEEFKLQGKFRKNCRGYFFLISINEMDKAENSYTSLKPDKDSVPAFIPESLLSARPLDEMRDIVSVFLSFRQIDSDYDSMDEFSSFLLKSTETWGGYFSRISFGDKGGSALINFGMPVAYEDNISRALTCTSEIIRKYKSNVRAGITFGRLFSGYVGSRVRAAYDVLGDSVNLSARIAMKTEWGSIWLSKSVSEVAKKGFLIHYIGEFLFKGKSGKTDVYQLGSEKSSILLTYKGSIFGREKEINLLKKSINPIFKGRFGGIVYIYGEPGIGKSRLVHEAVSRIHRERKLCTLQCDGIIRKAWNPFIYYLFLYFAQDHDRPDQENELNFRNRMQFLIDMLSKLDADSQKISIDELRRGEPFIKALLSLDTKDTLYEELDAKHRHDNTIYALKEFFKALSLLNPLIMNIEDIHYLDTESSIALWHLTRNIEKFPIIIICTSRYCDDGSKPEIFSDSNIPKNEIDLERLTEASSEQLIAEKLKHRPNNELAGIILERTSNNPFFIEQFCFYLLENGYIEIEEGLCSISKKTEDIPSGINQILIARIDRLSRELRELTKIASVFGREFNNNILFKTINTLYELIRIFETADKSRFDTEAVKRLVISDSSLLLSAGERESIWENIDEIRYIFKHSLLSESAYNMQMKERLRILHRTAGETIEKIKGLKDDRYIDLAYHFERAGIKDKAIEYMSKAGDYLRKTYKNKDALEMYKRLVSLLEEPAGILETKLKIGEIMELTGNWEKSEKIFRECVKESLKLGRKNLLSDSYQALSDTLRWRYKYSEALEAIKIFHDLSKERGDKKGTGTAFGYYGTIYGMLGDFQKSLKYFKKYRKIAEEIDDHLGAATATGNMGIVYLNLCEYEKSLECHHINKELKEKLGDKRGIASAVGNMGNVYYYQGKFDLAVECYELNRKYLEEIGDKRGMGKASGNIAFVYFDQGRYREALEHIEIDKNISDELGDKYGIAHSLGLMGDIYAKLGKKKRALGCYERAINIFNDIKIRNSSLLKCILARGDLLIQQKDINLAQKSNNELFELAKKMKKSDYIFNARLQKCRIMGKIDSENAIKCLQKLISNEIDDQSKARLYYELYSIEKKDDYRKECIRLYRYLYEKIPKYGYMEKIKELTDN